MYESQLTPMKILALFIACCFCISLSVVAADSTPKLALIITGHTNDVSGVQGVVFQITNTSSSSVTFTFETQVRKNEPLKWYPADVGHPDMITLVLPAKSSQEIVRYPPMQDVTWRALVFFTNSMAIDGKKRTFIASPEIAP
jgi:hypothetical protein